MADLAEQLILLTDTSIGLLNRAYYLLRYTPTSDVSSGDTLITADVLRYGQYISKKYPIMPSENEINTSKFNTINEQFIKQSNDVWQLLSPYYTTFLHISDFTVQTRALIDRCSARYQYNVSDINLYNGVMNDICNYILQLYTNYIKIHMLLDECVDSTPIRIYLSLYVRAYTFSQRQPPDRFNDIQQFIAKFSLRYDILKQLQGLATNHSTFIASILQSHYTTINKHKSSIRSNLISKRMFNLLDYDSRLLVQHNTTYDKLLTEFTQSDILCRYGVWLYLLCPQSLEKTDTMQLLQLILNHEQYIIIHRDVSIDIISLYEWLFAYYKVGKFKLYKHIKLITDMKQLQCTQSNVILHSDLRALYCVELESYYTLFRHQPKLITTRIHNIFSLLSAARSELLWYMTYLQNTVLDKASKQVNKPRSQTQEYSIVSIILYYYTLLVSLVRAHRHHIAQYMYEFLVHVDTQLIRQWYDQTKPILSNDTMKLIDEITQHLPQRTISDNYEALRLNYYRISSTVLSSRISDIDKETVNKTLVSLYDAVQHCRLIDSLSMQLKNNTSLHSLYWYRVQLYNIYKSIQPSPTTHLSTKQPAQFKLQHSVLYTQISLIELYHDAIHNVHRLYPGEQSVIGSEMKASTDTLLKRCMLCIESIIDQLTQAQIELSTSQLHYSCITERLLPNSTAKYSAAGTESYAFSAELPNIKQITLLNDALHNALQSLHAFQFITIYNVQFCIVEYLNDMLTRYLTQYYTAMWFDTTQSLSSTRNIDLSAQPPLKPIDIIHRQWNTVLQVIYRIGQHVPIDTSFILSNVILNCNTSKSIESTVASAPAIDQISKYFVNLVSNDMYTANIIYNAAKQCYQPLTQSTATQSLANLTDMHALNQLSHLLADNGIHSLSTSLLSSVNRSLQLINAISNKHTTILSQLHTRQSVDYSTVIEQIGMSDIESVLSQLLLIGQTLTLRHNILLRAHTIKYNIQNDTELIEVLNKYNFTSSFISTLPILLASTMLSNRWKQITHTPTTNSITYNLHLTQYAISALLYNISPNTRTQSFNVLMSAMSECTLYCNGLNSTGKQNSNTSLYTVSVMTLYIHQLTQLIITEYDIYDIQQFLPYRITNCVCSN